MHKQNRVSCDTLFLIALISGIGVRFPSSLGMTKTLYLSFRRSLRLKNPILKGCYIIFILLHIIIKLEFFAATVVFVNIVDILVASAGK